MLKISVITAVKNGVDAVKRTVDSVVSQTYPNVEFVVVDGESTDGTTAYLTSRSADITVLRSDRDRGIYDAFNRGLALATGDVIGYLNAGDVFVDSEVLARIMEPFNRSTVEAVFGDVAMTRDADPEKIVRLYASHIFRPSRVRFGFMPAHPTLYMRRIVYEQCGGYDPSFKIAGDFELIIRAFVKRETSYKYLRETLVRMSIGGLSTQGWRSKWQISSEMLLACKKNDIRTNTVLLSMRFPPKILELFRHPRRCRLR